MMKKLLVFAALGLVITANAQQRPHYTQYILNNYIINPAVAGIENYTDVKISHRHQWVGLDGAPVTTYITIHGPMTKSSYDRETPTTVLAPGENPRGKAYWEDYTAAVPHHGLGFTMINDRPGPLIWFTFAATYAEYVGIAAMTWLSAGSPVVC
jgi:type IX secretion system PorP/SprF family membrane protein